MELTKQKIHSIVNTVRAVSQITLDDDYNVPDYRPDIVKVLKEKGSLNFEEVKIAQGAVWVKGKLGFQVLYRSDQDEGKISTLRGEIPFQEKINMDDISEYDPVKVKGELEDLSIGVIHPRKINIRAVVSLHAEVSHEADLNVSSGAREECEQQRSPQTVLDLLWSKKDTTRQKSEIVLPSSKPNVREILWKSLELRNANAYLAQDGIRTSGEVLVSVLYSEEEEPDRIQWYETMVPLECRMECEDAEVLSKQEGVITRIQMEPATRELEVKPDYDGEERILLLELVLNMEVKIWEEKQIEVLEDMYSLQKEFVLKRQNIQVEQLHMKNESQCRLTEQMQLPDNQEKILQICSSEGAVQVDRMELLKNGMQVEGILSVELLYISTEDQMPIGVIKEIYPFEQLIELPEQQGDLKTELECNLIQLSAVMLDQEHVEIKAVIGLNLLALKEEVIDNIVEVEEQPADIEKLQKSPGFIGYIAKEGDKIWDIAKENHTTVSDILANNNKSDAILKKGEKILIIKSVG